MNKEMKRSFRIFILKILAVVFVLCICYFLYAFVYRAKTELPTKAVVTNRGAAVYTLRGQKQMLSQKEDFSYFAFDGREKEKEYGTYVIPGLKNTRTLLTKKGATPAMCTSMTPQGLAVTEDYVLVSAYCSTQKHNSVIYVIDKENHNFIKEVILPGQPHVGGLAYDPEHKLLWCSSNINGIAQAVSIKMDTIEAYDYDDSHLPVDTFQIVSLYGIVRDSFMTFYKGCLYVGCFEKYNESVIARYGVDEEGKLINTMDEKLGMDFEMAVPLVLGKKIIIIGDHKQLPPMLDENTIDSSLEKIGQKELAEKLRKAESQFKRLFESAAKVRKTIVSTLDTQYRMHEDIMNTIKQFYEEELAATGGLKCGILQSMDDPDLSNKGSRWHGLSLEPIFKPEYHAIWIDVTTPETRLNPGYKNEGELKAIDMVLKALQQSEGFDEFMKAQKKPEDKEIGIITFYSAQSREIKRKYKDCGYRMDVVDRFQGMERNIIIVSTVRSNAKNNIGFAKEIERINVAFSRARRLLIVVGNKRQFESNSNYAASIQSMKTFPVEQLRAALR